MNIRTPLALALTLLIPLAEASSSTAPPISPEQRKALFEQAGTTGPQHQRLSKLAGNWAVTVSLLMDPEHPTVEHGMATFATALGGRHLRQELRFSSMGKPFEGVGYIGYDNVTEQYFSSWMDTSFTGAMLAHGDYDAAGDSYTFHGGQADPTKEVAMIPVREVLHVTDKDHFTYEYYEVHRGQEAIAVSLKYARVK